MLSFAVMRAYKFLNEKYGLKSIYERRLRRTRINELNDPFELRPYDLTNPHVREAVVETGDALALDLGLLCFSADWCDPLIWAHYSDKHKGLCLGFEIPSDVEQERTRKVEYIEASLPFPNGLGRLDVEQKLLVVEKMIFTKYRHWEYEHEIRTWTDLKEGFFDFCDMLQLVEVIIGERSALSVRKIKSALGSMADHVMVMKARAAHDKFEMVEDKELT